MVRRCVAVFRGSWCRTRLSCALITFISDLSVVCGTGLMALSGDDGLKEEFVSEAPVLSVPIASGSGSRKRRAAKADEEDMYVDVEEMEDDVKPLGKAKAAYERRCVTGGMPCLLVSVIRTTH